MKILESLFEAINIESLSYCLVRNFKSTELGQSPDIDFLLEKKSYKKFKSVLTKMGFKQIFSGPFPGHAVFIKDNPETNGFINIDLHIDGLIRDGLLYLPAKNMISRRKKSNNYFIPSNEDYVIGLIMHCIIDKKKFKKEYKKEVIINLERKTFNKSYFEKEINNLLPIQGSKLLNYLKKRNFDKIVKMRSFIIIERFFLFPKGLLNMFYINSKRFFKIINPFWNGELIVFLGPEGGGKSSNSKLLRDNLKKSAIRSKQVYMGWHELILPFYWILKKTDNKFFSHKSSTKTNIASTNKLRSIIIFFIYFTELYIRYLVRIMPARKIGVVVTTDRYFYDGLLLYEDVPNFLKKIFYYLIPKPSSIFYLMGSPKTLHQRKPEVPTEILEKQFRIYESNYKKFNSIKISSEKYSKEKVANIINSNFIKI